MCVLFVREGACVAAVASVGWSPNEGRKKKKKRRKRITINILYNDGRREREECIVVVV